MTTFYHGSPEKLESGKELSGRGASYEEDWLSLDSYLPLERARPTGMIAHKDAVFMVCDPDDIDAAGGATDWCSEVEPLGKVECHDMAWGSRISELLSDGFSADSPEVVSCAEKYWSGEEFPGEESLFEYLTTGVRVVRCEPFETFEVAKKRSFRP